MEHTYVSLNAPKYKVRIRVGKQNVVVKFQNSVFKTDDSEIAKALDAAIHRPNSALILYIRKVDKARGEEISRAYQEKHGQRAMQGPFSSNARAELLKETLSARAVEMTRVAGSQNLDAVREALGGNMELQEHVPQEPHPVGTLADAVPASDGAPAPVGDFANAETPTVTEAAPVPKGAFTLKQR